MLKLTQVQLKKAFQLADRIHQLEGAKDSPYRVSPVGRLNEVLKAAHAELAKLGIELDPSGPLKKHKSICSDQNMLFPLGEYYAGECQLCDEARAKMPSWYSQYMRDRVAQGRSV